MRLSSLLPPRLRQGASRPSQRPLLRRTGLRLDRLEDRSVPSAGAMDPSLGVMGFIPADFGGAVALQGDGKILLAGTVAAGDAFDFAVARYNPDGTPDAAFGSGGKTTVDFGVAYGGLLTGIVVQNGGKIVLVGTAQYDFALARLNADGSLDAAFGTGGKVLTNFSNTFRVTTGGLQTVPSVDFAEGVAIQNVGGVEKIVVVGTTDRAFALARYDLDGTLDLTFGSEGKVSTHFALNSTDYATDLAIQPDGKIVAVGSSYQSTNELSDDFAIARYDVNGLPDPTFGVGGKVTTNFAVYRTSNSLLSLDYVSGTYEQASAVALQADGKIVVAGGSYGVPASKTGYNFALARYNADGTLDSSFGDVAAPGLLVRTGFTAADFGLSSDWANDLIIQSDGQIVLVGGALARYTGDGSLDGGFGIDGVVRTHGSLSNAEAAVREVVGGEEKILVAGRGLARFHAGGEPPVRLSVAADPTSIVEGNSGTRAVTFTVSLSAPHDEPVTVKYDTPLDGRITEKDFAVSASTLTFQPGETTKNITIAVNGDTIYEWDEYLVLRLADATNAVIERPMAYVAIINDDNAPVSVSGVSLKEGSSGSTAFTFTITVSQASERYVNTVAQTVDGTAIAGSDYGGQLVVLDLTQPQTAYVTVWVQGDAVEEVNETFTLRLNYNGDNGNAVMAEAVGTIVNDDGPPPHITISDVRKKEGHSGLVAFVFTVSLSHASTTAVTVNYATAEGTATAGSDYQTTSGTLTFNPGETTKTVTVYVTGDKVAEADETFFLNLSAPTNAVLDDAQAIGTIQNDDR